MRTLHESVARLRQFCETKHFEAISTCTCQLSFCVRIFQHSFCCSSRAFPSPRPTASSAAVLARKRSLTVFFSYILGWRARSFRNLSLLISPNPVEDTFSAQHSLGHKKNYNSLKNIQAITSTRVYFYIHIYIYLYFSFFLTQGVRKVTLIELMRDAMTQ